MSAHPYKDRPEAGKHEWLTPKSIVQALGVFDLDPCASPGWDLAKKHIYQPLCGLRENWVGRIWLNPPYGKQTSAWLEKMSKHGNGIALVFARTETKMFQQFVWPCASSALFIANRPHFHHEDGTRAKGNSGGPMMLISYDGDGGSENKGALSNCSIPGCFVEL